VSHQVISLDSLSVVFREFADNIRADIARQGSTDNGFRYAQIAALNELQTRIYDRLFQEDSEANG
jgi:hypothetical protein